MTLDNQQGIECFVSPHGPVFYTHSALRDEAGHVRHGFFSKMGGVSSGIYDSLNCGLGSDDHPERIEMNRLYVCQALSLEVSQLAGLYQTHSANCLIIDHFPGRDFPSPGARPLGDGLVTKLPNIGLAILSADCLPILFSEERAGIIGACHAGWRGTLAGIIENTVAAIVRLGGQAGNIHMVIGPAIHQKSYQIGPDMADAILLKRPDAEACFIKEATAPDSLLDTYLFDLPLFAEITALRLGVVNIHHIPFDTYAEPDLFFSHRRATHNKSSDSGRLISIITRSDESLQAL